MGRCSPVSSTTTLFTSTTVFDLGGSVPKFISDSISIPTAARSPLRVQTYFIHAKPTAQFSRVVNARELGQLLVHKMEPVRTKQHLLEAQLRIFIHRTTVLRELADAHPWIPRLLAQVLCNKPSRSGMKAVSGELAAFTERDASRAGARMGIEILYHATSQAAVR
jgi:hypothetical protein